MNTNKRKSLLHGGLGIVLLTLVLFLRTIGVQAQGNEEVEFTVFAINDFHGGFVNAEERNVPGAYSLLCCLDSLKEKHPINMVVSAGDNFGGSYFSNQLKGTLLPVLFKDMGITLSALGNHELDNGEAFLADKWSHARPADWDITYVCANIYRKGSRDLPSWAQTYKKCSVRIPQWNENLDVVFTGLIAKSVPKQVAAKYVDSLEFDPDYCGVLKNLDANLPPANLYLLLTHIGTQQNNGKIEWSDNDEDARKIPALVKSDTLKHAYQALISGHSHKKVCGDIGGLPVIQGDMSGRYIGMLNFKVSRQEGNIICTFQNKQLVPVPLKQKKNIELLIRDSIEYYNWNEPLIIINDDLKHERGDNKKLTALGSYVCAAYADAYRKYDKKEDLNKVVIGFSHFGGIRTSLPKGILRYLDAGEVLPFTSELWVYHMTGKRIRELLEAGLANQRGWLQANNLIVDYRMSRDGKMLVKNIHYIVPGKVDILLSDRETYPIVVDSYVATGGDGYPIDVFKSSEMEHTTLPGTTIAFIAFIRSLAADKTCMGNGSIYQSSCNELK